VAASGSRAQAAVSEWTLRHFGILNAVEPSDDPGWRAATSAALLGSIPIIGLRLRKQSVQSDGLVRLRSIYLSFVVAIVTIGVVVVVLTATGSGAGKASVQPVGVAVALIGIASASRKLVRRPLPAETESGLAAGYRKRFFGELALAESAALAGFVGFMLTDAGLLYPLGAVFTAVGFGLLVPTSRHLARDQDEVRQAGSGLSLVAALRRPANRR